MARRGIMIGMAALVLVASDAAATERWTPIPHNAGSYADLGRLHSEGYPEPRARLSRQAGGRQILRRYQVVWIRNDATTATVLSENVFDCEGHYAALSQHLEHPAPGIPYGSFDWHRAFTFFGPTLHDVADAPDTLMIETERLVCAHRGGENNSPHPP